MYVSDSGFKRTLQPQGLHLGICTEVIDLGTQEASYQGKAKRPMRKVAIRWALPSVLYTDGDKAGQPMLIGKTYTALLDEKSNLRKDLQSWRGQAFTAVELKKFSLSKLLGKPCQIQIIHETKGDKTYANIKAITGVMAGTPIPAYDGELRSFDLDDFDAETFAALPDWQKETIVKSPEYAKVAGGGKGDADDGGVDRSVGGGATDDDIPF